jgi:hypothetical protein
MYIVVTQQKIITLYYRKSCINSRHGIYWNNTHRNINLTSFVFSSAILFLVFSGTNIPFPYNVCQLLRIIDQRMPPTHFSNGLPRKCIILHFGYYDGERRDHWQPTVGSILPKKKTLFGYIRIKDKIRKYVTFTAGITDLWDVLFSAMLRTSSVEW